MGTWTRSSKKRSVSAISVPREIICCDNRTSNKDWDIDGCALYAHIAAAKYSTKETSIGSVASLGHFIAAVELGVTTSLYCLLDGVVSLDRSLVGSAVTRVLALVADILVTFSVVTRRGDLANGEGRSRDDEGESQEREDVLGKHGD